MVEHGHRLGGRDPLRPRDGGVLDRGRRLVDVPLDAQLEADVAARRAGARPRSRGSPDRRRRAAAPAPCPAPAGAGSAPPGSAPTGSRRGSSTSRWPRCSPCAGVPSVTFFSIRIGLARAEQPDQPERSPSSCESRPPAVALANSTNWRGVARVGDREVRHQQVVRLLRRHLDPQRHPAQVRLGVGLAGARRVGEPDRCRVRPRRAGRSPPAGPPGRSRKRSSASIDGESRLGVERAVDPVRDPVRAGRLRVLELDAHDVAGQPARTRARSASGLPPAMVSFHASLHAALPGRWCRVTGAARCGARLAGHQDRNRASIGLDEPGDHAVGRRAVVRHRPAGDLGVDDGRPAGGERGARTRPRTPRACLDPVAVRPAGPRVRGEVRVVGTRPGRSRGRSPAGRA